MSILSWFSKKPTNSLAKGKVYAVTKGKYLGEFLVYIRSTTGSHHFLSLPKMNNRSIPSHHFESGMSKGILDFQEVLPKHVTNICISQFNKNET